MPAWFHSVSVVGAPPYRSARQSHSRTSSLPPSSQVRGLCGGELLEQTQQYVSSRAEAAAGVSSGDGTGARPLVPPADAAALFCASFQSSCDQAIEEFRDAGLHFGKDDEFGRGTAQAQAQVQAQNEVAKMMFLKQQVLRWGQTFFRAGIVFMGLAAEHSSDAHTPSQGCNTEAWTPVTTKDDFTIPHGTPLR